MAHPKKKVKRKSNNVANRQQQKGGTRKQKSHRKISDFEVRNLKRTSVLHETIPSKRRRTTRYNIQQSDSVILVGETPCCQTAEQLEKYTRLGLNSALFLKGSQRPKRKQSHISIITISSDDEETSEERTSEWISSLDQNYQSSVEPELRSTKETTGTETIFQPLCSSTPNTSQLVRSHPSGDEKAGVCGTCTLTDTEMSTENSQDHLNGSKEFHNFSSTSEVQRSAESLSGDQVEQEQTFQLVISVPYSLTDSQCKMQYQPEETRKAEVFTPFSSQEYSAPSICDTTITGSAFHFDSSIESKQATSPPALSFGSHLNNASDNSTFGTYEFGTISNEGMGESNGFKVPDFNCLGSLNKRTSVTSASVIPSETCFNEGQDNQHQFSISEPNKFKEASDQFEDLSTKMPHFYFGSFLEGEHGTSSTTASPFGSYLNNEADNTKLGTYKFGTTSNEGQGESNEFKVPDCNYFGSSNECSSVTSNPETQFKPYFNGSQDSINQFGTIELNKTENKKNQTEPTFIDSDDLE